MQYIYKCPECGHEFKVFVKRVSRGLTAKRKCPECNANAKLQYEGGYYGQKDK